MNREAQKPGKLTRTLFGWLPIASVCIIAWANTGTSPALAGTEAGEISFRVRDAFLFSLPLFLEQERANSPGKKATQHKDNDYEAIKKLLQWNAETYFRELNALLADGGIEVPKTGAFRTLASVGIGAGRDFRFQNLSPERARAVQAGYEQGQVLLLDQINQFRQDPLGTHLNDGFGARVTFHSSQVALR